MAFPWTEVAAIAAAAGAGAAWRSAGASREAVARANRPFVWPEWTMDMDERLWRVRLHNDGPGVALDVRWSVYFERFEGHDERDAVTATRAFASEPIRGMGPGDSAPPIEASDPIERRFPHHMRQADLWSLVVRFTDSAGVRWEYVDPWDVATLADRVRRLRRIRSYRLRPHRWWRRVRSGRPPREWFAAYEPADW